VLWARVDATVARWRFPVPDAQKSARVLLFCVMGGILVLLPLLSHNPVRGGLRGSDFAAAGTAGTAGTAGGGGAGEWLAARGAQAGSTNTAGCLVKPAVTAAS
jgi:hypothetical protein